MNEEQNTAPIPPIKFLGIDQLWCSVITLVWYSVDSTIYAVSFNGSEVKLLDSDSQELNSPDSLTLLEALKPMALDKMLEGR